MLGCAVVSVDARAQSNDDTATEAPPQEAIEAYTRAREHYKQGNYPAAIHDLELALALDPDSPDLLYNVARVYELMGELNKAVAYYKRYRSMLPTDQSEERDRVSETIERLQGARQFVAPEEEDEEKEGQELAPPPPPLERGVADGAFWTVASASLASFAAAGGTGVTALQRERELNEFVLGEDGTEEDYEGLERNADRLALTTDVLLGAGGVMALTAVMLYALRTQPAQSATSTQKGPRLTWSPLWHRHGAGFNLSGRF